MDEIGKKFDGGKIDWTILPFEALEDVTSVLLFGEKKYGRYNYLHLDKSRILKAMFRHLISEATNVDGNLTDTETGYNHIAHLAANCLMYLHMLKQEDKKSNDPL